MTDRIENAQIEAYGAVLTELSRPPSRGGNTTARHSHWIAIEGEKYWFIAPGSKKWVFKHDSVSFNYETKNGFRQICLETLEVRDKKGIIAVRGVRQAKAKLRTAGNRMPVSRHEARR